MLAETVSIDGGTILVLLVIAFIALALFIAMIVFGFILAPRAARGSSAARGWLIAIFVVEGMMCLASLGSLIDGTFTPSVFFMPVVVALQVAAYLRARPE